MKIESSSSNVFLNQEKITASLDVGRDSFSEVLTNTNQSNKQEETNKIDFTNMTMIEFNDWVHSERKKGNLTDDEANNLYFSVVNRVPVSEFGTGERTHLYAPRNFIDSLIQSIDDATMATNSDALDKFQSMMPAILEGAGISPEKIKGMTQDEMYSLLISINNSAQSDDDLYNGYYVNADGILASQKSSTMNNQINNQVESMGKMMQHLDSLEKLIESQSQS